MSKQPDTELEEALLHFEHWIKHPQSTLYRHHDFGRTMLAIQAYITKAQLQLVDELMEQLPDKRVGTEKMPLNDIERGYNVCVEDAISVLQQYKANLSGGTE